MSKRYYTICEGQSILDIALEVYGDIEGVFTLIEENPEITSVNAQLLPGQQVLIDSTREANEDVVRYYTEEGIRINSRAVLGETSEEVITGLLSFDNISLRDVNEEILIANDQ